jgi:hypothetical protein
MHGINDIPNMLDILKLLSKYILLLLHNLVGLTEANTVTRGHNG